MKDSDVVAYIVIRILLFSSAFQHASIRSSKDKIHCTILHLAHRETMGAVVDLFAEMQRIKRKYGINSNMAAVSIGNIVYFDKDYFCNHILEKENFPSNQECKSNLDFVSETLSNADKNKMKSVFVENNHCLLISGQSNSMNVSNQKPFWVLNINVEQISRCCMEFARHVFP